MGHGARGMHPAAGGAIGWILAGLTATLAAACGDDGGGEPITVIVSAADRGQVDAFLEFVPHEIAVEEAADPASAAESGSGIRVAVSPSLDCTDCYRVEARGDGYVVLGGPPLGSQYGLARFLEELGFRFYHPHRTHVPDRIEAPEPTAAFLGETVMPEMSVRGMQIHTLHPLEGYYDLWEPGEDNLEHSRRIIDWLVKNRGNFLQWVPLDNIQGSPTMAEAWREHTRAIVAYAHERGIRVGINVQLFGSGNLQKAFDLLDGDPPDVATAVRDRISLVLPDPAFDVITLSFGEFFGEDPAVFLDALNAAKDAILEVAPGVEIPAVVHVGDDQRVLYDGQEIIYYFLVAYADPEIIPWVHTTMYFNLFDPAAGAYEHEDFAEHRQFLLDELASGGRVAYFPESAYWVAFDNSVPTYMPVYMKSRWIDMDRLKEEATALGIPTLDEHVLFSSGWEWGYWQNDYTTMRATYRLPDSWETLVRDMLAPLEDGDALATEVIGMGDRQHQYLILNELAPYLAGRDSTLDLGEAMGIFSQPDRTTFGEVQAMDAAQRATFVADVVDPLATWTDESAAAASAVADLGDGSDPFVAEIVDGAAVNAARIRFVHATYQAAVSFAQTGGDEGWLDEAAAALEEARAVVARRHANLHDPDPEVLLGRGSNATLYQHGYLHYADNLCYWERELTEARNLIEGAGETVPGCVL